MKIRFYLATAIVALSWMGCSQEEATNEIMSGANVIQATIESSSRSAVTDAGVFSWTTGDEISLLDESNNDTYTYSGTGNGFNPPVSGTVSTPVVAYYPANENHNTTEFYLPDTYGNVNTEYVASTNAAMIATPPTTDNTTYAFMHLGGVMRFNVKNVPVDADGFQFTVSGKKITGAFEVKSGTEKTIETAADPSSNNTVTIRFKKLTEAKDMTFYVPMPTGTYNDYTVGLFINNDLSGHEHTSTNVTNTIARKTLLLMPTFTWNGQELEKGEATVGVIDLEDGSQSATITDDAEVVVTPGADADATATLNYTPAQDGSSVLSISDGSGATESGESEGKVVVSTADDSTVASCDINTPSLTVELSAADGGTATFEEVTALTAEQTLVVGEGVTINTLIINGGNVVIEKGATVTTITNNATDNAITVSDEAGLRVAIVDGVEVILESDIELSDYIEIRDINVVINLNNHAITHPATSEATYKDVFEVYGDGELTIEGEGSVVAENGYSVYAAGNSVVTLNGGYYFSPVSAVDARKNAVVTINGGEFKVDGTNNPDGDFGQQYTLNLRDKTGNYASELANIIVKGGSFYKYNPAESYSEPTVTNFVADGYSSIADGDYYIVTEN